jgi:hypothetical protein
VHRSVQVARPGKALTWLIADPSIQGRFHDELMAFVENKAMSQGARQKARRILQGLRPTYPSRDSKTPQERGLNRSGGK